MKDKEPFDYRLIWVSLACLVILTALLIYVLLQSFG